MIQKDIVLPGELKIISEEGNKGRYEVDKLYPGYGHTLGNSLRRIILSSIPGVAVTRVFIDGVPHEFSTIDGVREDVINIILNLKRVVFKYDGEEPIRLSLNVDKAGEVTAKSIETPSQVEIVNPEQYLFTLEKKSSISIDFEIMKGLGYVSKESIQGSEKLRPGEIVMDSSFTPIRRVSYEVSTTRVGDRTDFNKISLFIETDGSIKPREVLKASLEILVKQFSAILSSDKLGGDEYNLNISHNNKDTIIELNLPKDLMEKIATHGILRIDELESMTDDDILEIEGIGEEELKIIRKALNN